jgi:hypothetical protein
VLISAASIGLIVAVAILIVGLSQGAGGARTASQEEWANLTRGDLAFRWAFSAVALAAVTVTLAIPFLPFLVRVRAKDRASYDARVALIWLRWALSASRWAFVAVVAVLAAWGLYRLASHLFALLNESVAAR